jgi:hypothetical protein
MYINIQGSIGHPAMGIADTPFMGVGSTIPQADLAGLSTVISVGNPSTQSPSSFA